MAGHLCSSVDVQQGHASIKYIARSGFFPIHNSPPWRPARFTLAAECDINLAGAGSSEITSLAGSDGIRPIYWRGTRDRERGQSSGRTFRNVLPTSEQVKTWFSRKGVLRMHSTLADLMTNRLNRKAAEDLTGQRDLACSQD